MHACHTCACSALGFGWAVDFFVLVLASQLLSPSHKPLLPFRKRLLQEHQLEVQALQNRFRGEVESAAHEQRQSMQRAMESQQLKFEDLKQNLIKEKHVELSTLKAQHATETEALGAAHRKVRVQSCKELMTASRACQGPAWSFAGHQASLTTLFYLC